MKTFAVTRTKLNTFDVQEDFTARTGWAGLGPTGELHNLNVDRSFTKHHVWVAFGAYHVILDTTGWNLRGWLNFQDRGCLVGRIPLNHGTITTSLVGVQQFIPSGDGQQPSLIVDRHPASPTDYQNTMVIPCWTFELQFDRLTLESTSMDSYGFFTTLFLTGMRILSTN